VEAEATGAVAAAIERARAAQRSWAELTYRERADALRPLKKRILARAEEIASVLGEEARKPYEEALLAEVLPNADLVHYWTNSIEELLATETIELDALSYPGKVARVERVPRGVIALITPWNYPIAIPLRTLLPALLSGNAVVFKPSEHAARAGQLVASLFDGLGPEHLVTLLQGDGAVGQELGSGDVDAVVFTGSVATGKKIGALCAERLVCCSLELGGNDAAIVLADAPIERTARGLVWGAFTNLGQNCASIERVYVERGIAEALIERIVALTAALDPERDLGQMTTAAQAAIVRRQIEGAVASGAKILTGELAEDGSTRVLPIVLRVDDEDCDLMRDETFGPVLPIVVVDDEDAAIERANASTFGLTASIWTKRVARAQGLARRLRAGVVTINNHGFTAAIPSVPWSGLGHSGSGVTNGPHALPAFVRTKLVLEDRNSAKRELWWYPYTPVLRSVAREMAVVRGGGGFFRRIAAFFALLAAIPRRLMGK